MELVHIVAGGLSGGTIGCNTSPDLILHNQHSKLFQLLAKFLDVIADKAVLNVHIGSVVEEIERALHIDFKCCRHALCLCFLLL